MRTQDRAGARSFAPVRNRQPRHATVRRNHRCISYRRGAGYDLPTPLVGGLPYGLGERREVLQTLDGLRPYTLGSGCSRTAYRGSAAWSDLQVSTDADVVSTNADVNFAAAGWARRPLGQCKQRKAVRLGPTDATIADGRPAKQGRKLLNLPRCSSHHPIDRSAGDRSAGDSYAGDRSVGNLRCSTFTR